MNTDTITGILAHPTRVRYAVLALVFSAAFITYLDRVCISVAAPLMQSDLHLNNIQFAWVFTVFYIAYGVMELPSAWLGDRWGQRRMLIRIVSGWSIFTILTGTVRSFGALLITRTVFGGAEASWHSPGSARVSWIGCVTTCPNSKTTTARRWRSRWARRRSREISDPRERVLRFRCCRISGRTVASARTMACSTMTPATRIGAPSSSIGTGSSGFAEMNGPGEARDQRLWTDALAALRA